VMNKELVPEARDFKRKKEEGHGFHRTCCKESSKTHNNPWEYTIKFPHAKLTLVGEKDH
jgi:hypothetical protein